MAVLIYNAILYFIFGIASISGQDDYIVGGTNAYAGQVSYQVSMRNANNQHFCGGSIIENRWILTAAHCISSGSPTTIVVGTIYLNSGGVIYSVEKVITHQSYNSKTFENDIALVKTAKSIEYNNNIQPIAIPLFSIGENVRLLASGWGLTSSPGTTPNNLQVLTTTTITNEQCAKTIGQAGSVFPTNVCTYNSTGRGLCQGDSGGPLAKDGKVHGIVSWVLPCAIGFPDGNTRVQSFKYWIWWTRKTN